jgi:hypothetical protein
MNHFPANTLKNDKSCAKAAVVSCSSSVDLMGALCRFALETTTTNPEHEALIQVTRSRQRWNRGNRHLGNIAATGLLCYEGLCIIMHKYVIVASHIRGGKNIIDIAFLSGKKYQSHIDIFRLSLVAVNIRCVPPSQIRSTVIMTF